MTERRITEAEKDYARTVLAKNPFVRLLGIKLVDLEHGEAVCSLQIEEKHLRAGGFLHGGVTASVIDTVAAFAVATRLQAGENSVTVDLTLHFLRPVFQGEIVVKAKVLRIGKRLATVSAELFDQQNQLAATALMTYSKIKL